MEAALPLAAVGEILESPESPPSRTASHAAASISSSGNGRADAWWKRAAAAHIEAVRSFLKRLKSWLWQLIDSVLEEFEPWLKWVILDAVLALAAAAIVQRVESLRPTFELFGWA